MVFLRADTHNSYSYYIAFSLSQPIEMILHEGTYVQLLKKEKKVIYNWLFHNMLASSEDWQPMQHYSFSV